MLRAAEMIMGTVAREIQYYIIYEKAERGKHIAIELTRFLFAECEPYAKNCAQARLRERNAVQRLRMVNVYGTPF